MKDFLGKVVIRLRTFWPLLVASLVGGLICLGAFLFFGKVKERAIEKMAKLPDSVEYDLPEFKGRIFSTKDVSPGTFKIIRSFEETRDWGEDAIMTYSYDRYGVYFNAWRNDPKTDNVFEFAQMEKDHNVKGTTIQAVKFKDGKLIASLEKTSSFAKASSIFIRFIAGCGMVASALFGLDMLYFCIPKRE